jgi:5-methylcytosine-specific restriction endonuclease McrA
MPEPTWREIRELTRLRRRQAATMYCGITQDARERIAKYDASPQFVEKMYGLIASTYLADMWHFQCGRCYMCDRDFRLTLFATREHVRPKAKGGINAGNLLLACVPCNNVKADRDPTKRELRLLALFNTDARLDFHRLLMTNTPAPETIAVKSKRRIMKERGKRRLTQMR